MINIYTDQKELDKKIQNSKKLIQQFCAYVGGWENTYVAFSGGKDSTVLLHLVRSLYPNIPAVFSNTLIEFPETYKFIRGIDNVIWLNPTRNFQTIIKVNGWPIISKKVSSVLYVTKLNERNEEYVKKKLPMIPKKYQYLLNSSFKISDKCCYFLKKSKAKKYEKQNGKYPFLGIRSIESDYRGKENTCNILHPQNPKSFPILKWNTSEIWNYIKRNNLAYNSLYDIGWTRTGCMFCLFGIFMDGFPNRVQRMAITHPKQYHYFLNKLGAKEVLEYLRIPYLPVKKKNSFFETTNLNMF